MSEITELRRSLAEGGTSFAVVKNTLMRRAANDAGLAEITSLLDGPSAVAFVDGDPVAAAKSVVDSAKKFPTLVLKGGFMDGKILSADEAKALASLESREAMLSKIAGLAKSEMSKAAALFVGAQSKFLSVLDAYRASCPRRRPPSRPPRNHRIRWRPQNQERNQKQKQNRNRNRKRPRNEQPQNRDQPKERRKSWRR